VYQSHIQHKQVGHAVVTTFNLKYTHVTCIIPRLLLEVEKRAALHMLLNQFSHNFKKSTDLLQPVEELNSHSLLQGLFLIIYES